MDSSESRLGPSDDLLSALLAEEEQGLLMPIHKFYGILGLIDHLVDQLNLVVHVP